MPLTTTYNPYLWAFIRRGPAAVSDGMLGFEREQESGSEGIDADDARLRWGRRRR